MARVKICGINDPLAFDTAVEAGADWVGCVFFPASPRAVSPQTAAALSARMPGGPPRVGLFVDPTDQDIAATLDVVHLDILQIYGRAVDFPALKARFALPLWRPVGVASAADLPRHARWTDTLPADALLIEAKPPLEATRPGGNGVSFQWPILKGWAAPAPWLLAGGLTVANVATAICQTGASAVDVSSGVERTKGVKDAALIRSFIQRAKDAAVVDDR